MGVVIVPFQAGGPDRAGEHSLAIDQSSHRRSIKGAERMERITLDLATIDGGIDKCQVKDRIMSDQPAAFIACRTGVNIFRSASSSGIARRKG